LGKIAGMIAEKFHIMDLEFAVTGKEVDT